MHRLLLLLALLCPVVHARDYPDTAAAYLTLFDSDRDGRISAGEYVEYLSAGFRAMDANSDGVLDAQELPPGPRPNPRTLAAFRADVRAQFGRLDQNHDGCLSARELAQPPR